MDSGAYTAWTGILDQRLIARLEGVQPVFGGQGDTITTGLFKKCKGLAACVRELHRIRHKLMQAMMGEVKARTKVSTHRRYTRRSHRSALTHANIRQYTFSQDSTQLQQARHSVWRDNHVLTTPPPSQGTGAGGPDASLPPPAGHPLGRPPGLPRPPTLGSGRGLGPPRSPRAPTARSCHPCWMRTPLRRRRPLMYMIISVLMCI